MKKTKVSTPPIIKKSESSTKPSDLFDIPFSEKVNEYLGIPYRWGGISKKGIDCSGLTKRFYAEVYDLDLPHNSYQQSKLEIFEEISLDLNALQPSDLLFFANNDKRINHVGIYLEDGKFLHAIRKGVRISSINSPYWKKRLVALRRIKDEKPSNTYDSVEIANEEIALGYTVNIDSGLYVNMEAFHSGWFLSTDQQQMIESDDIESDDIWIPVTSWKGLRASANIYPIDWIRIKPSVNIIDTTSLGEDVNSNWQIYRLDVSVAPHDVNWSVSLSVQSLNNDNAIETYPIWMDSDMGIRFNYSFSEQMGISLYGTWEYSPLFKNTSSSILSHDIKDLMLNLKISF